ncbi:hypothetical protein FHS23_004616 [Prauserella isguenensis]|uniref:Uncharacterized protein n=1 Tax=Prauserella isguenensis TaxID=1470180 RepID=A0A839S853_9PSEU|nr:hypothetical protein [Prauserella isguenensis]MBB3053562.1 hypothetical protein [Prauserella isguenensis]
MPYSGGDIDGPCDVWEAAPPELAAQQRELHQRCLDGDIDHTELVRW